MVQCFDVYGFLPLAQLNGKNVEAGGVYTGIRLLHKLQDYDMNVGRVHLGNCDRFLAVERSDIDLRQNTI